MASRRNKLRAKADWPFTFSDARIKLKQLSLQLHIELRHESDPVRPFPKETRLPLTHALIARRAWICGLATVILTGAEPACAVVPGGDVKHIMVIGDSQAQGIAAGLQWLYRRDPTHRVLDRSKISTGLTSRSVYDWPAAVHTLAANETADVAVIMFGANDRPPVRVDGHVDAGLLQSFQAVYSARVRDIVQTLTHAHIAVIWVGHPIVRDPAYAEDMVLLNRIFSDAAVPAGAVFMPLWDTFLGPDHGYSAYGPGIDGQTVRLRADDGVHLTTAGYQIAAKQLQPLIDASAPSQAGGHATASAAAPATVQPPAANPTGQ